MIRKLVIICAAVVAAGLTLPAAGPPTLTPLGTVRTGLFRSEDPRAAEINAYDPATQRIYVVNPQDGSLDIIDAAVPAAPVHIGEIDIVGACQSVAGAQCPLAQGAEPNSVAIHGRWLAVALGNLVRTDNGHVVLLDLHEDAPAFVAALEVGALPDMVVFSEDGRYVLTANEGEPNATYTVDPPGSVSVIDLRRLGRGRGDDAVRTVGFDRFDTPDQRAKLEAEGVRIFGPNATVAQDLEPEYIAVRNNKAYVTLQENNALAIINIAGATVERVVGLGLKDHSLAAHALDASDQDGINIRKWPVWGLYEPDAIDTIEAGGRTYLVMANEGDTREYAGYVETVRLGNAAYILDQTTFPNASTALKPNSALGRLNVSTASGDLDGDGDFDRIEVPGGRSVSIRDHKGNLVWDSGDMFERLSASLDPSRTLFNTTNSANSRDNRSDDKGVEPESVVVGEVRGRLYAFVGLERDGGIVVLDVTDPARPHYATYVTNRKFPRNPATGAFLGCGDVNDCGDLGPEGLTFVSAGASPTGKALLIVSNEVSSTTTLWQVE